MATYIVGDIQGCLRELKCLLAKVSFNPEYDQLYLTGDLVARGPQSLETLRFISGLGDCAKTVLGNHDLHLLAIYAGIKKANPADKLHPLLEAKDTPQLLNWLKAQPLLLQLPGECTFISHAGLSPQWTPKQAMKQASKASKKINSADCHYWLKTMYGNLPNRWQDAKSKEEKFIYTINAFTRMRFCYPDNGLEFKHKLAPKGEQQLTPWFEQVVLPSDHQWLFGHWAALMGNCPVTNIYALDTGCVWGNHMTMLRWEDKSYFTQQALGH
jgi:bis(5'-nucleosyl)-tetraphosphatase (symmetrical)